MRVLACLNQKYKVLTLCIHIVLCIVVQKSCCITKISCIKYWQIFALLILGNIK